MADTIIGRTLISDSYATTLPVFEDKPEPPKRERIMLTRADLKKRWRCSDEAVERTVTMSDGPCKFPAASRRSHGHGAWTFDHIWSDMQIERWEADARDYIAALQQIVGKK